jgi:hypothetical protein
MNTIEFCEKYLENYKINSDGTIDVDGAVNLDHKLGEMTKIPVKFGKVSGNFNCSRNQITTLEGSPNYVEGDFDCYNCKLITLNGGPNYVGGMFCCFKNKLTTLEGCPKYVGENFDCDISGLTSLKGIEKCEIIGDFYCRNINITPENYIYILTAKIGGDIRTTNDSINDILYKYKNEVKYLHKALSELKKVVI